MTRETNSDVHIIQNDVVVTDIQILPQQMADEEIGFTKGITRDRYPMTIDIGSVNCYAKQVIVPIDRGGPMMHYFVKVGISGFLFDPWGLYSEGTQAKDAKHLGRPAWDFRRVNKECFNNYIRFLMTRNKAHFNLAEREIRSNA